MKKINKYIKKFLIALIVKLYLFYVLGKLQNRKKKYQTKEILTEQIKKGIPSEANNEKLIIAYEPIWAIGTGLTPSVEDIDEIHNFIKKDISGFENYKVIYGGSVNSSNSKKILAIGNVDGVLVGGASINIEEFNKIIASQIIINYYS